MHALAACCAMASDAAMHPTYDRLAAALTRGRDGKPASQRWIAIAGGPGSGKSTLAAAIAERVNAQSPGACVVLPMDGFHYSRAELRALDPPNADSYLPRRGAPWTFDAEGCCKQLRAARDTGEATLPTYSRELSDPVPGGARLERTHSIILVEGNYLLLFDDPRWAPLRELWDERWFIKCPDAAAQRRRLILRHLETWNEEKTARWGAGEIGAAARADANDVKNMALIAYANATPRLAAYFSATAVLSRMRACGRRALTSAPSPTLVIRQSV